MFDYDPTRIGERSAPRSHEIEKGAIRRFAEALGEKNSIYFDEKEARAAGFPGLPAPPTFPFTLPPHPIPGVRLPQAGIIHGEQEFIYGRPICAGDIITVSAWLDNVKVRQGHLGSMTILTIMRNGLHQNGDIAFQSRSIVIVTEEVQRDVEA